jgi:transposase
MGYARGLIETDELREFGYSKNFRFNTTQVVLALATNEHGLPIGYELFKGNEAEVKTLIASISQWRTLMNINSVCFVGDRAMFSKDNLALLDEHGYSYVIAAKLRKLPKPKQDEIVDEKYYRMDFINKDVLDVMVSVQSSIHVHKKTGDKYRLPGSMPHNASCIYRTLDIQRSLDATVYQP